MCSFKLKIAFHSSFQFIFQIFNSYQKIIAIVELKVWE